MENLLHKFIPQKILLEPRGSRRQSYQRRDKNPHVQTLSVGLNAQTAHGRESLDQPIFPSTSGDNRNLQVTVYMSIKESLSFQNSWFSNINFTRKSGRGSAPFDLRDYIKINVIECVSATELEQMLLMPSEQWSSVAFPILNSVSLRDVIGSVNSVLSPVIPGESSNIDAERRVSIKNIPYKISFDYDDIQPDFLAYITWTEFDLEKIANDFDFFISR